MDQSKKSAHTFTYFDLLDACKQPGCPVCRLGDSTVRRYLSGLFYEFVNDPGTRDQLHTSMGFCDSHVTLLLETRIADGLGASIIYQSLIHSILRDFQIYFPPRIPAKSSWSRRRAPHVKSPLEKAQETCPACEYSNTVIERAIHAIAQSLHEETTRAALQKSDGLCLPHLWQALDYIQMPVDAEFLTRLTRDKLENLQDEMVELIRKHDYRFNSEGITQEEAMAWRNAMCMISGASLGLTLEKPG